jgi:hypothetical protein
MPISMLTQASGSRRSWFRAAAALVLTATQARAQVNPFRSGRYETRLSPEDIDRMLSSANQVNRTPGVAVGSKASWGDPKTGSHGTSTVERIFKQNGMTCHLVRHETFVRGDAQPRHFDLTWCLTPADEWKVLN